MIAVSIPSSVVIEGAILGLNYGLLATGLVLIYRTNRVINFAQGQLGVVAAVFLVKLYYDYGINYWAALAAALLLAAAVGALSELLLRRLFNRPRVMVMVATIGLSQVLFLFTLFPFIRPKKLFRAFPVPVDWSFHIGTFLFRPGEVVTLIVAPDRRPRSGRLHPLLAVGPRHAGLGRELRVGPAVGGVGAAHVHRGLDPGRSAVRLHGHPDLAQTRRAP